MRFECSHCGTIVAIDDAEAGNPVGCGNCGGITTVPDSSFAPGAVINDFVIRKVIGHGGMGQVYLAHQQSLDRPVALKILMEEYSRNSSFIVDFVKEARAAARLNHPNIVQSYAVGEENGIYFFAMEYVEGETLTSMLHREGALPIKQSLNIIQQIAEALDFAWKNQQLVHRDVKPDNIMLTKRGVAKLADLGLARAASEINENLEDDEVMGTPQYICPEQLLGHPMDIRGDIYSLGASFYQMVTGQFPFNGKNAGEIARKHLNEPLVPAHKVEEEVPPAVSFIISKMLAKKAEDRYSDGTSLCQDLALVLKGESPVGFKGQKPPKKITTGPNKATSVAVVPSEVISDIPKDTGSGDKPLKAGSSARKGTKIKRKTKLKTGGTKGKSSVRMGTRAGATTAGTRPLTGTNMQQQKGSAGAKGGGVKVLIGLAIVVVVVFLSVGGFVGFRFMRMNARFSPKSVDEAQKLYFSVAGVTADEKAAFSAIEPYIEELDRHEDDADALREAVKLASDFVSRFPDSLFTQNEQTINYANVFGASSRFASRLETQAAPLAGSVSKTLSQYEEALIRQLRKGAHGTEGEEIAQRVKESQNQQALDDAKTALANHLKERAFTLRQSVANAESALADLENEIDARKTEIFSNVLIASVSWRFRDAKDVADEIRKAAESAPKSKLSSFTNLLMSSEETQADTVLSQAKRRLPSGSTSDLESEFTSMLRDSEVPGLRDKLDAFKTSEKDLQRAFNEWQITLADAVDNGVAFFDLVSNTGKALEGTRVVIPRMPTKGDEEFRLSYASRDKLILRRYKLNFGAGDPEVMESLDVPMSDMSASGFMELARKAWLDKHADIDETYRTNQVIFGFLLGIPSKDIRGGNAEGVDDPGIKLLAAEWSRVEPLMLEARISSYVGLLESMVKANQKDQARLTYQKIRRQFGETAQFQKYDNELKATLE